MSDYFIAFYFSKNYGSEYRASVESFRLIQKNVSSSVELIVSDIELNDNVGCQYIVKSIVKNQKYLYKFTDFLPQFFWHINVFIFLIFKRNVDRIYISGVMPWNLFFLYSFISQKIYLLPVGGSSKRIDFSLKEYFRILIINLLMVVNSLRKKKFIVSARTTDAYNLWKKYGFNVRVVLPEIITPIKHRNITFGHSISLSFLWIGQDIPRKNFPLAMEWYNSLRLEYPNSHLHVFGIKSLSTNQVTYHGWVKNFKIENYLNKFILLNTSCREGLPSSVIEAIQNGGLVITKDVGSVSLIKSNQIIIVDLIDEVSKSIIISKLDSYFNLSKIEIKEINFTEQYIKFLQ